MESLRSADRSALRAWMITRVGVVAIALTASALWQDGDLHDSFVGRWTQWDVDLFLRIARYGYDGAPDEPSDPGLPAFFPGFPLLLRAVHTVVPSWGVSALLISLIAGAVAMVALARLGGPEVGPKAVLALLLSPYAVFLFAGYSEALFLAFALPAWLLAKRRRWGPAAVCAAGAGCVRITGLFLAAALIVEFLVGDRRRRKAGWLAVPFLPILVYAAYLYRRTGDWLAWLHAQEAGWGRSTVWPWQALSRTWQAAFETNDQFTGAFRVELIAAAVGIALTVWLLVRRHWAESAYVGLQMASLLTSAFYLSIGRATLVWWPLWLAIGALGVRRFPAYVALLVASVPVLMTEIVLFTSGSWAG